MALFILSGNGSSLSARIYILSFIILVLVCSFSYCSSSSPSSFGLSSVNIGNNVDNFDIDKNINDERNHYYGFLLRPSSSAIDYTNSDEHPTLSKNRWLNFLLKTALTQEEERLRRRDPVHVNSGRRSGRQSFQAMRG